MLLDNKKTAKIGETLKEAIGNGSRLSIVSTFTKRELQSHIRKLRQAIEKCKSNPITMIGTVLHGWCSNEFPDLIPAELPTNKCFLSNPDVQEFIILLGKLPFLDAAYWLSSSYALLREDKYRKSLAMYFTPPYLTERLLDDMEKQGVNYIDGRFFDPACGGAAFLAPLAFRIKTALKSKSVSPEKILNHFEEHLFGMDIDSALCALSTQFLKMTLYEEIKTARYEPTFQITTGNSLCDLNSFTETIDVVVCNPPYRKVSRNEIDEYRLNYDGVIEGQPNMYGLFIALSINLLKQKGICALVTPTSFLSGQYFTKLRGFLLRETQVLGIGMVSDRSGVFIDVLQETALTFLRRSSRANSSQMKAAISIISRDGRNLDVGPCVLPNSGAAWPIPRVEPDVYLLKKAALSKFRIKDYGYAVRIGTFVWNRDQRPVYMSSAEVTRRNVETSVPLIWASDVKSGSALNFDGTKKTNGEPCFVDFGDKNHCSVIRKSSVILQRVTSNEQRRRIIASAVPKKLFDKYGGFVGENHTVILEKVVAKPVLTPKQMAELLGSEVVDRCFRCISGSTNVSSFELNQLSLPDPFLLKRLLIKGRSIEVAAQMAIYGRDYKNLNASQRHDLQI